VKVTPAARAGEAWRPWTIWLPCVLAFLWSGLLIVADDFASLMGSWDTPQRGLGWITAARIGHSVLAAASVLALVIGLSFPSWRRAAAITAWMIIPIGLGWVPIARLIGSS
jgi:hypothetical protein